MLATGMRIKVMVVAVVVVLFVLIFSSHFQNLWNQNANILPM